MGFKSQASPNPFHNPSYLLLEPFLCGFACVRIIIPVKGPLLVPFQTLDTWLHIIFKPLIWRRIHCWNSDRKLLKKQNNSKPPWFIIIARFFVWKSLVCLQLLRPNIKKTPVQVVCTEFYLLDASGIHRGSLWRQSDPGGPITAWEVNKGTCKYLKSQICKQIKHIV